MSAGGTVDGEVVTLRGTAFDAHAGAVLLLDDESPVYVEGLSRWSPEEYGKRLEVTGTLRSVKLAPDPVVGEGGTRRHGMAGTQTVVVGATWRVVA
jgi:hypothetical protein